MSDTKKEFYCKNSILIGTAQSSPKNIPKKTSSILPVVLRSLLILNFSFGQQTFPSQNISILDRISPLVDSASAVQPNPTADNQNSQQRITANHPNSRWANIE